MLPPSRAEMCLGRQLVNQQKVRKSGGSSPLLRTQCSVDGLIPGSYSPVSLSRPFLESDLDAIC